MAQNEKVDVCIVGSGAAGGSLSLALAEAGIKVVVLEVGPWWNPLTDYIHNPLEMPGRFRWNMPVTQVGDRVGRTPHSSWGVGGGMNHWTAAVGRFEEEDFKQGTLEGMGADWPFSYADLVPYYEKAEAQLGVSGLAAGAPAGYVQGKPPNPAHRLFYANQLLKKGFDKLGIPSYSGSVAINSQIYKGRPACNYCGGCSMGCPIGAKANTAITHFPQAIKLGVEVRARSYATQIRMDNRGRAKSVVYFDFNGVEQEQEANIVVAAGWTIESPRLLLNSATSQIPDGLANSSGLVGRGLTCILGGRIRAIYDEPVDGFRGFNLNNLESRHFYKTDASRGYWGGWTFEASSSGHPLSYANQRGRLWGHGLIEHMKTFRSYAALSVWGRATVSLDNRVTIDDQVKDEYGIPAAKITYHFSDNDHKLSREGRRRGEEAFEAAGAKEVWSDGPTRGSYWLGGLRMGSDPAASVTNGYGQTHDIPNLFVVGPMLIPGAVGIQPTLTIVALGNRIGEYIGANRQEF